MAANIHELHPDQAELLLVAAGAAAAGFSAAGAAERIVDALVLARWRAARDKYHASGNDPGVHHHLRSTEEIVVKRSIGLFADRLTDFSLACVLVCLVAV